MTQEAQEDILEAIPDPKDLEKLLNEERTKRNGEAKRVALLLFKKEIIDFLIKNKERILSGGSASLKLKAEKVGKECGIEPPHQDFLQEIADEIQRILEEKTYTVSCEIKTGNWWEITVQRAPSL